MTIISLRGTNGAGKSTLVRAVMDCYATRAAITYPGKLRPRGYVLLPRSGRRLFVPGHYEIANGGVDTLSSLDSAYDLIRKHAELKMDVLYEGKNMSDGPARLVRLHDIGLPVAAVLIDLDVDDCVAAVRARGHKIARTTIQRLHGKSISDAGKLAAAGVPVFIGSREGCLEHVKGLLAEGKNGAVLS